MAVLGQDHEQLTPSVAPSPGSQSTATEPSLSIGSVLEMYKTSVCNDTVPNSVHVRAEVWGQREPVMVDSVEEP